MPVRGPAYRQAGTESPLQTNVSKMIQYGQNKNNSFKVSGENGWLVSCPVRSYSHFLLIVTNFVNINLQTSNGACF